MKTITTTQARINLYKLVESASLESEPILITGKRAKAVLVSEDDWLSIQETLYLLSIPGMRESIIKGMNTPIEECSDKLKW